MCAVFPGHSRQSPRLHHSSQQRSSTRDPEAHEDPRNRRVNGPVAVGGHRIDLAQQHCNKQIGGNNSDNGRKQRATVNVCNKTDVTICPIALDQTATYTSRCVAMHAVLPVSGHDRGKCTTPNRTDLPGTPLVVHPLHKQRQKKRNCSHVSCTREVLTHTF